MLALYNNDDSTMITTIITIEMKSWVITNDQTMAISTQTILTTIFVENLIMKMIMINDNGNENDYNINYKNNNNNN